MYIQDRLFSESDESEKFYSVIMTEEEAKLYSEFQKEFGMLQRGVKAVKNVIKPITKKLNVGKFVNDAKGAITGAVKNHIMKNPKGIVAKAAGAFKEGRYLDSVTGAAKDIVNKYKA